MSQTMPIFTVDAFTSKPFAGNPAAVCLLGKPADAGWMQAIAAEMNLSETAFVHRLDQGFALRWFTPTVEVDLCGHATLATAHILREQGWVNEQEVARFFTRSGWLTAQASGKKIVLDFPLLPAEEVLVPDGLLSALGLSSRAVFFNGADYLVEVESEAEVRQLHPDSSALKAIKARGIIITALASQAGYDFVSRFFAPACGINEDPVTGSAHCTLAPFWAQRLGRLSLQALQVSARSGEVFMQIQGERVLLAGEAVTIAGGQLYV